jgi:hypothetical protein
MNQTSIQTRQETGVAEAIEKVLMQGDLSKLTPEQRMDYYKAICNSLGLNHLTRPFDYITLNGKLTLYAKKDATDQLRRLYAVSITSLERETIQEVYLVTAHASVPGGREDTSTGAVSIKGLTGDNLANAFMKAETKAKRRATLSICGLGMLDETEAGSIPGAEMEVRDVTPAPRPEPERDLGMSEEFEALWMDLKRNGYTGPQIKAQCSAALGGPFTTFSNLTLPDKRKVVNHLATMPIDTAHPEESDEEPQVED